MRKYSRLLTLEERKHRRKAVFYTFLTVLLFILFIFFGLSAITRLGVFISDLRPKSTENNNLDKIPPPKPRFLVTETATNSATLTISGTSEAGSEVLVFQNGNEMGKLRADASGLFQKEIKLFEGENNFTARAKDNTGNESQNSETLAIILDTKPPEITITEPQEKNFTSKQITIRGRTNEAAQITINNRTVMLNAENNFSLFTKLNLGENKFTVRATDNAGNTAEEELTLTLSL